ncbi:MAG: lamin tail domain-containing protein [Blastocatellia bacterium]|nr:lamin tail domain-containing protein [Blastocatellia bacterium]
MLILLICLSGVSFAQVVPGRGTETTLDIASWNIEWFGDTGNGPTNEALQLQNASAVITGANMDIWGVAEIVSLSQWNSLKAQLPGYAGFLAKESNVVNGAAYYSGFNNTEQNVGILYKSSIATVLDARVILTANDADFAGRPPLQVTLRVTLNGTTEDVVVIVVHAKCCTDATSWTRRNNASIALKSYLDANFPTQKVWVIGDFNDDVDTSITPGSASPYANFVNSPSTYRFPTAALSDNGISSTVSFTDTIDHHLASNEANATYVDGSVEVFRVDAYIGSYGTTTSDHYPVLTRYNFGSGGAPPVVSVVSPNGGESWAGGAARNITWTSVNVANVRIEYTLNNGTNWTVIASSTPASAGSYAWTVPSTASTSARVRISDVATTATDQSDGTFTITVATPAQVIVNEIRANEPGSNTAGEFVEIVNIGGTAANIGGWTISDASSVRHTFPAGTTLNPGKAIVVFGGASAIPGGLANAVAATTGGLSLGNSSDTVRLRDNANVVKSSFSYTSALAGVDGVSMNRNPDGTTGSFVLHTSLSSAQSSAGVRASGLPW